MIQNLALLIYLALGFGDEAKSGLCLSRETDSFPGVRNWPFGSDLY